MCNLGKGRISRTEIKDVLDKTQLEFIDGFRVTGTAVSGNAQISL